MGRHAKEFTDEDKKRIKAMAGYGIPQEQIARIYECDAKTLRKHCRKELDEGPTIANSRVAESLYQQAIGGNVTAAIFWCKTRMRWTERVEHTGAEGEPLFPQTEQERNVDLAKRIAVLLSQGVAEEESAIRH